MKFVFKILGISVIMKFYSEFVWSFSWWQCCHIQKFNLFYFS